ncbi:MAG: hypothetical protein HRJ53_11780 [Acidobacteria bacterium Pan2503]|uniref:Uncharacterized protein n=1 Tax=Candidatus Acidiferrum panamense TaxID=2741543 RepID=A0A7V8SXF5_9BACT|nr:hypothetical protein [Candidatus Acidoferrum panamensis]
MTIPLPVISGVWRVTFNWHNAVTGWNTANVMHFREITSGPLSSSAVAGTISANLHSDMWVGKVSGDQLVNYQMIRLDGTSATAIELPTGSGWAPVGSGDVAPQVAAIIKLQTGIRGRSNRGRIYLSNQGEANTTNGAITPSSIVTAATTAWTTFQTNIQSGSGNNIVLGVASYMRAHGGSGAHFNPATNIVCETMCATQRRRQPGRKVARH